MGATEYLITAIIPAYNASKTIGRCLDSILMCDSIEIIVVNDGSTDNTCDVVERYSSQYDRIKLINKINEGVSKARNVGIEMATGKWIMFVDSDDTLNSNITNITDSPMNIEENCNLVLYSALYIEGNKKKKEIRYKDAYYCGADLMNFITQQKQSILTHGGPWAKLFLRDSIVSNNIRFDENLCIAEDRLFYYEFLKHIYGVKTSSLKVYNYYMCHTGLREKQYSMDTQMYRLDKLLSAASILIEKKEMRDNCKKVMYESIDRQIFSICKSMDDYSLDECFFYIKKIIYNYSNYKISVKTKVKTMIWRYLSSMIKS